MELKLEKGRPVNEEERLEKEMRTYDLLDQLGIEYDRVDHEEANTMEACQEIDEVLFPAVICKNLFLCNAGKNKFYLLMIGDDKMFKTKDISKQIGSSRLSFAPSEYMEKYLDITPGSVSVLGLMNDKEQQVKLVVDEDILKSEYFGCHPCINTSSLRLRTKDVFERFLPAVRHDYVTVKIEKKQIEKMYDVVALGEMLIDFAVTGESEQGNQVFEACPGGAPCNVLSMLNRLGKRTAFIGKVGNDSFGKLLKTTIEEIGIEARGLLMDEETGTTLAFVHTLPDGDRDFSFYRNPGADMMLRKEEVNYDLIRQAKIFHFGTLSMTDEPVRSATKEALKVAKEAGCLISFDPNLRPPLWRSLDTAKEMMEYGLGYCDILKISDNEIQFVSGKEDYDEGIQYLIEKYHIPLIFLTLGKDGSRAYYKGKCIVCDGFQVATIETTGAGDTFCGSVLGKVAEKGIDHFTEEELRKLLTFANAAAAVVTTRKGALCAMPNLEEVIDLIE